jgi:hypothetical protein
MATLTLICGYLICGLIGFLGVAVLWKILDGTIDLSRLISEPNGDASMGRFQFLVFTFVISLSLFLVIVGGKDAKGNPSPAFPESIPGGILTLLGISGSSYAVGKAIQFSDPAGVEDRPVTVTISPTDVIVHYSESFQFTATVARKPDAQVKWEVTPGRGSIDPDTGLYKAPARPAAAAPMPAPAPGAAPAAPAPAAAPTAQHATVKATCIDFADVSDVAVITLV